MYLQINLVTSTRDLGHPASHPVNPHISLLILTGFINPEVVLRGRVDCLRTFIIRAASLRSTLIRLEVLLRNLTPVGRRDLVSLDLKVCTSASRSTKSLSNSARTLSRSTTRRVLRLTSSVPVVSGAGSATAPAVGSSTTGAGAVSGRDSSFSRLLEEDEDLFLEEDEDFLSLVRLEL